MHTKKFDFCCDAPGCTEGFYNRRLLECHREEVHNKELKYTCDQCGMMFFSQYRLGTHVTRRHNASRYNFCWVHITLKLSCFRSYANESKVCFDLKLIYFSDTFPADTRAATRPTRTSQV
jgi:hypothetical protein